MSEQSTDELRLRATEAQMRRALGLGNASPAREHAAQSTGTSNGNIHRRHFVRDGEVPVTVVPHEDTGGTNKLEAARQALREQTAAREQVERQLAEAQATIQALETQLAHDRIAKAEALKRVEDQRQQIQHQLEQERAARQQAEQDRDAAIAAHREAEARVREVEASRGSGSAKRKRKAAKAATNGGLDLRSAVADRKSAEDSTTAKKRRGRPAKVRDTDSELVEWWKSGWKERFR